MTSKDSVFSAKSKTFAHVSPDNRLHLWDVDTRKEKKAYVDKNHLSHSTTCFSWKKSKKDKTGEFVVGFSDGTIVIWDLTRGVISRTIGKVNESPSPTDIVFSNDSNSIFVSSNNNNVVKYNLTSGEVEKSIKAGKKGILKLASNPKANVIAAASSSIRLIDIDTERTKKLEGSFSGGVAALVFSSCGRYLAAASATSREILIFDVTLDGDSLSPIQVVPVNGVVSAIEARTNKSLRVVEFLVLFEEANGCVFRFSTDHKKNEETGVDSMVSMTHIDSGSAQLSAGYIGDLSGDSEGKGIVLAVGQKSHPLFIHVEIEDVTGKVLSSVNVSAKKQNGSVEANGKNGKSTTALQDPSVLGPHEMGGTKRPLLEEVSSSSKKAKQNGDAHELQGGDSSLLLVASSDPEELTLEQRLESLSRNLQRLEDASDKPQTTKASLATPTTDSLVTLVDQALQSGDDALLEQCLVVTDNAVVEATARRLPTGRIVVFLRKLVAKFEKRPSRGLLLTRWLSSILRYHTSYLITVPDLSFQLAGLSQMLEQRLASYTRLSSLAGRLDLLLSQVSYQQTEGGGLSKGKLAQIVPEQIYQM